MGDGRPRTGPRRSRHHQPSHRRYRFFFPPLTFTALSEVTPAALAAAHRACIDFRIFSRASLDIVRRLRPGFAAGAVTALAVRHRLSALTTLEVV